VCLKNIAEETWEADLMTELNRPSNTLPEEYEKTMTKIRASTPRSRLAMRVFSWLVSAKASLQVSELCDALAINAEDPNFRMDHRTHLATILDVCHRFVIVNEISATIELFHYTAKEFLLSLPDLGVQVASEIPKSCLAYLSFEDFDNPCSNRLQRQERLAQYPMPVTPALCGQTISEGG
jgi:hypothetical protein